MTHISSKMFFGRSEIIDFNKIPLLGKFTVTISDDVPVKVKTNSEEFMLTCDYKLVVYKYFRIIEKYPDLKIQPESKCNNENEKD